jgi:SHS2 domain-containing protein
MDKFKFLEHTADLKFQAFGKSSEELFGNSALAMFSAMSDKKIKPRIKKQIKVKGKDLESLLYLFLEELIFLLDSENFFLCRARKIKIDEKNFILEAEVLGDDSGKYEIKIDVKAVTYNEMFVKKIGNKWAAQVVLDV